MTREKYNKKRKHKNKFARKNRVFGLKQKNDDNSKKTFIIFFRL